MTEQEKDALIGALVRESQAAASELAHLQEKSRRVSGAFSAVAAFMAHEADPLADFTVNPPARPEPSDSLGFNAAMELANKIEDLRDTVRDLQKRKESFGLK